MHVHLHADLFGLVHDRLEHVDLGLRRTGLRRQRDLAGVLDPLRRQRLDRRPRLGRCLTQIDLAGRNDARTDELALVDPVAQGDVGVGLSAAGKDGGVARLEQHRICPAAFSPLLTCLWLSMKPGMALMPLASTTRNPVVDAAPVVTETIRPPRTTIVPESMTWPEPTMILAFVMATSCAAAAAGTMMTAAIRPPEKAFFS